MKVLSLHNRYRQSGGEDRVALLEAEMLRAHGIDVVAPDFQNSFRTGVAASLQAGWSADWSSASYDLVYGLCMQHRPDVAHVHNFWMKLTPAVHAACQAAGVPTVQTLHNFRLLCANSLFLRNGKVCEDCLGRSPWRGVARKCYRESALASAAVVRMIVDNRKRGTWCRDVDAYIALTEHSRAKFVAGGLPSDRIFIKPNFLNSVDRSWQAPSLSNKVLYAGRLSPEKGLAQLIEAWAFTVACREAKLLIIGDGPDRESLEKLARSHHRATSGVVFLGQCSNEEVRRLLQHARAAVLPSLCFENFPNLIAEAYCAGRAVVASDLGALRELVDHGRTGLRCENGNIVSWSQALARVLDEDDFVDRAGAEGRSEFLKKYTAEHNFEQLMRIYYFVIEQKGNPLSSQSLSKQSAISK
jgi:glycosyltransferase involved in cell wall biosynthesis